MTLEEARKSLREGWEDGLPCPCCTQFVKLYPNNLTGSRVVGLIQLVRMWEQNPEPVHVKELKLHGDVDVRVVGGTFALMRHWGLIETEENTDPAKRASGRWRPTQDGIDFVNGKITQPKTAYIFNNHAWRFGEERVNIREALGIKFNYEELMGSATKGQWL